MSADIYGTAHAHTWDSSKVNHCCLLTEVKSYAYHSCYLVSEFTFTTSWCIPLSIGLFMVQNSQIPSKPFLVMHGRVSERILITSLTLSEMHVVLSFNWATSCCTAEIIIYHQSCPHTIYVLVRWPHTVLPITSGHQTICGQFSHVPIQLAHVGKMSGQKRPVWTELVEVPPLRNGHYDEDSRQVSCRNR